MRTIHLRFCHLLVATALLLGATVAGCKPGADAGEDTDSDAPLPVRVTVLGSGSISRWLGYVGDIEGQAEIRVYSPIPDRVTKLPVKEGDRVKVGDVLATVRAGTLSQGVQQAAGGLDAARAQRDALEDQVKRLRQLQGSGAVTSSQVLNVEAQFASAEAQVRQLKALLGQARQRRGDAVLRSPIRGVIGQVFVKVGDLAAPQLPVCTVVDMDRVLVKVRVPEPDLPLLEIGQAVELRVAVSDEQVIHGAVSRVSPVLDRLSRTSTLEVDLENPGHVLKPGMLARIRVEVERHDNALVAPRNALTVTPERDGDVQLYRAVVANGGVAEERKVRIGISEGDQIEVLEGLAPGEALVVEGQHLLAAGDALEIVDPAAPTATGASSSDAGPASAPPMPVGGS